MNLNGVRKKIGFESEDLGYVLVLTLAKYMALDRLPNLFHPGFAVSKVGTIILFLLIAPSFWEAHKRQ